MCMCAKWAQLDTGLLLDAAPLVPCCRSHTIAHVHVPRRLTQPPATGGLRGSPPLRPRTQHPHTRASESARARRGVGSTVGDCATARAGGGDVGRRERACSPAARHIRHGRSASVGTGAAKGRDSDACGARWHAAMPSASARHPYRRVAPPHPVAQRAPRHPSSAATARPRRAARATRTSAGGSAASAGSAGCVPGHERRRRRPVAARTAAATMATTATTATTHVRRPEGRRGGRL